MGLVFFRRFIVKLPKRVTVFYSEKKKVIALQSFFRKKIINLCLKINLSNLKHFIYITNFKLAQNKQSKQALKVLRAKHLVSTQKAVLEILTVPYKKIFFFGIGFKVAFLQKRSYGLLKFNLGFSHNFFIRVKNELEVCSFKIDSFLVFSHFYSNVYSLSSKVLRLKKLEPYKVKGFMSEHKTFLPKKAPK